MKKFSLLCITALTCMSLAACGSSSSHKSSVSSHSSSKIVKKHHKKQNKKKQSSSSSSTSSNANSTQNTQQNNSQGNTQASQQNNGTHVNNADDAVAAAKAKYGDDGGRVHWGYMIDASTGQPIRNADGSYFVKGTDDQTMSGTRYSVNVNPDGSMTSN